MFQSFWIGLAGFIAYLALILIFIRFPLQTGWFALELVCGFIVHGLSSAIGFYLIPEFNYWHNISIYAFLWFCFFFVTGIYFSSISVAILSYLFRSPNHAADKSMVFKDCIEKPFAERAGFFLQEGQVEKAGDRYVITERGKNNVRRIWLIRKLLGLAGSGFYSGS